MASTSHHWNKNTPDQGKWAEETYGNAYAADLPNLNKHIGGYQQEIRFMESSVKGQGHNFRLDRSYDLKDYPSILALFKELDELYSNICSGPTVNMLENQS